MAQSLQTLRNSIVTSVHGRALGLDKDGYLVGPTALKDVVEDLTTATTGTTLLPYGIARQTATGSSQGPTQHALPLPTPGAWKVLTVMSTSTGSHQFLSSGSGAEIFWSTLGSSGGTCVNITGGGGAAILVGLTTAKWSVLTSFNATNTTST